MCLENFSLDHIFLLMMAALMGLICYVDLQLLLEMFKDYFKDQSIYNPDAFENCYKPQAGLRICFQCAATYCTGSCVVLVFCVAINLADKVVEQVACWLLNVTSLVFGPVVLTVSIYALRYIKAMGKVCDRYHGIWENQLNLMNIFILLLFLGMSFGITFTMIYERNLIIAQTSFVQDNSVFMKLS